MQTASWPCEVDWRNRNEPREVLELAAQMAWERGGQTHPLSDYDIDIAREKITGKRDEIARLRKENAELRAALRAASMTPTTQERQDDE